MFDARAFQSWPLVLAGAVVFASLFAGLGLMTEVVFDGRAHLTRATVGLGGGAFLGYLAIALVIRRENAE
jgi:hypothetical protein